jgi:hypothetical protein
MMTVLRIGKRSGSAGSAFVISILVLFVLSVLGLALMLTTTAEKDLSVNYRWSEMAFFNADAGLEYGKNVLAAYAIRDGDFRNALPPARTSAQMNNPPEVLCSPSSPGCRDYQFNIPQGGMRLYIGKVLIDLNGRLLQYDFRNPSAGDLRGDIDGDGVMDVSGSVTIWVRRPISGDADYGAVGTPTENRHSQAIITAEGVAPSYEATGSGRAAAMKRLEVTVRLPGSSLTGDRYSDATKGGDTDPVLGSDAAAAGRMVRAVR